MSKEKLIEFYESTIRDDKKLGEWDEVADEEDYKLFTRYKGSSIEKGNFACRVQLRFKHSTSLSYILRTLIHPLTRMEWDASEYATIKPLDIIDDYLLL